MISDLLGQDNYELVRDAASVGSNMMLMTALGNPSLYGYKPGTDNIVQRAAYDNRGGGSDALRNGNAKAISNMSKEQLQANLPEGWTYSEHNGRVHIKDTNESFRVRIDPSDNVTSYQHMHILDEFGNPLDIEGNIVGPKSHEGHIPWDN